jgi:RNA-binding protein
MQLGKASTTQALLDELDRTLDAHELIKVRVLRECPDDLDTISALIEKQLKANVVGKLGHILVLYRRNPVKCRIMLPTVKKPAKAAPVEVPFDDDEDDDPEFESETWEES